MTSAPSPNSLLVWTHMGGKVTEVAKDATVLLASRCALPVGSEGHLAADRSDGAERQLGLPTRRRNGAALDRRLLQLHRSAAARLAARVLRRQLRRALPNQESRSIPITTSASSRPSDRRSIRTARTRPISHHCIARSSFDSRWRTHEETCNDHHCSRSPSPADDALITAARRPADATAPAAGPAIVLSPTIPGDAQFGQLPPNATNMQKLLAIQGDFDIYSWNTFIALNWPPGPDGNGDPKQDHRPERRQRYGVGALPRRRATSSSPAAQAADWNGTDARPAGVQGRLHNRECASSARSERRRPC